MAKLTFAPGYTNEDYPNGISVLPIEKQIDAFEKMYKIWLLDFAERLVTIPDSGFAVLTLLNAYPETVAQLNGFTGRKSDLFKQGIFLIFPELLSYQQSTAICKHLYSYMRSGLAHMSFTSVNIILSEDPPAAVQIYNKKEPFEVWVNPRLWFESIKQHFEDYISELKSPDNVDLREKFSARMCQPF